MSRRSTTPRPALVTDVMTVLQRRRQPTTPLRFTDLERRLPRGMYGTMDAVRGAAERDLLDYDDALPSRHGRTLTLRRKAIAWNPQPDGQPAPLTYRWAHQGTTLSGSLEDWAKLWAVDAHQVPGGPLGWTLSGTRHSFLPYLDQEGERWRIVVAGEQVHIHSAKEAATRG